VAEGFGPGDGFLEPIEPDVLLNAIGKPGVGNRIEAFRLARRKGWL